MTPNTRFDGISLFLHFRHSLLATELITKVNCSYGVKLRVQDLFSYPTLSSLCGYIDSNLNQGSTQPQQPKVTRMDLEAEVEKHDVCVVK